MLALKNQTKKTKRIRVAQILSDAADFHLSNSTNYDHDRKSIYSCNAVKIALRVKFPEFKTDLIVSNLFNKLGLPSSCPTKCFSFNHGLYSKINQQERYTWLKIAAEYCKLHDVRVIIKT